ncbi:V-type proton ATPase subunit G3-like [Hibiscus syriacus]|uniref:V-type proton ATPase subunit G3-like n=1 Tax=Hibiscus syriacus TaxID=106335 RepID=A0A6A3CSJ6_HIBSY|nr:eukaryotic translation initiation factor 4B2-like isoform X2 [Hibiscus syriacus]KAE8730179.1 V-type proton ATPase subunit G3-like [Hibiscus syriacus]
MSKPWGGRGSWAAEAEREEAEERKAMEAAAAAGTTAGPQSFPSLKEAVSTKPKKKKLTLPEFNMGIYSSSGGGGGVGVGARVSDYNKLTPDEMMLLPTRPKERTDEEMQYGRLGGGFSSYGRSGPSAGRGIRERDGNDGSWGSGRRQYGGFDEERRGPPSRVSDYDQPSRADEVNNWAMGKKTTPSFDSGRQNRYGGLGTGGGGGNSKADEVDNWTAGKRPIPSRPSTFGSGFRDTVPEPDRWTRSGGGGGFREEIPRFVLNPPRGEVNEPAVKTNKPNPFGAARPREEVLTEKGLDWKKLDSEFESKKVSSRPSSSHSSRSSSVQSSRSEGPQLQGIENVIKPRPKVNPFGDAKPREVLLEERGKDWRKIDLEFERRRLDRPETEEEKILKQEIDNLKKELEKDSTPGSESAGDQPTLHETLHHKERELEKLIRDMENKARFGQKASETPVSGSGRSGSFSDRPPSQSGSSDGSRNMEFMDRPRSRGSVDAWSRPADDRRGFQGGFKGGRDRGFLGNRDLERPRSRERW